LIGGAGRESKEKSNWPLTPAERGLFTAIYPPQRRRQNTGKLYWQG
jgi:hypothetical protein